MVKKKAKAVRIPAPAVVVTEPKGRALRAVVVPAEATVTGSVNVTAVPSAASMAPLSRGNVDIEREHKKLKVLPGVVCSTCAIGIECPKFAEGSVCGYEEAFAAFPARDVDSVLALMSEIVDENKQRWRRAALRERVVLGGAVDPQVTKLGDLLSKQTRALIDLQNEANKVTVSLTGVSTGTGVLSRLFGAKDV